MVGNPQSKTKWLYGFPLPIGSFLYACCYNHIIPFGGLATVNKDEILYGTIKDKTEPQLKEEIKRINGLLKEQSEIIKSLKLSKSVEIRTGTFQQEITRHGKKKKEHLTRFEKNPAKLTLGYFGNLEFLCYPYTSLDKFYIRDGTVIHGYDRYDVPRILALFNKVRWMTEHGKGFISGSTDSESSLATEILNAYKAGIAQDMIRLNELAKAERDEMVQKLEGMKERFRNGFLQDDPELRKKYERYMKQKYGDDKPDEFD